MGSHPSAHAAMKRDGSAVEDVHARVVSMRDLAALALTTSAAANNRPRRSRLRRLLEYPPQALT